MPKRSNAGRLYNRGKRARHTRRAAFRRRPRRSKLGKPSRGLRQSTYMFKRRLTSVVNLNDTNNGGWTTITGGGGMFKQWVFKLSDLADTTDFSSLFRRYKINAVKVQLAFSNTGSDANGYNFNNNYQLQIYTAQNRSGRTDEELTEAEFMNIQASKKRLCLNGGKPLNFYMRTNQLTETYASAVNTDYAVTRPRYVSTGETGCEHYGLNMFINRVDGQAFGTGGAAPNTQRMRCTLTYYLSFKGVE